MRILIIGGTGFTGPPLVKELVDNGHELTLFHRGKTHDPRTEGIRTIIGDRKRSSEFVDEFKKLQPDVVVDMIPFIPDDGQGFMETMKGVTPRVVALSSADVYLAYGRLHNTVPGPIVPIPLREDSPLRQTDEPNDYGYDNISVERHAMGSRDIVGTVLRLAGIYGPRDEQNRFRKYIKRIDDGRPTIIMPEDVAVWRFGHTYVDNVAHAIVLAIENERAMGQIYNVSEPHTPTEMERVSAIGKIASWTGEVLSIPREDCPDHLTTNINLDQDMVLDTSKIRSELGYEEIVSDDDAYTRTIEWQRNNISEIDPKEFDYAAEDEFLKRRI